MKYPVLELAITEYEVEVDNLGAGEGFNVALLSDIHECDQSDVINALHSYSPHMILMAGDTFERHDNDSNSGDTSLVSRLAHIPLRIRERMKYGKGLVNKRAAMQERNICIENSYNLIRESAQIAPVYMSLGNHERRLEPEDRLVIAESGAVLLENEHCQFTSDENQIIINGKPIVIGGLTSIASDDEIPDEWLRKFSNIKAYKILLCHHPEYYERCLSVYRDDIDLICSGHAHGGQIRILNRGVIAPGQGLLPKYHHGFYDSKLIVSAGLHYGRIPRWGNPREIVMIRFKSR